MPQDMVGMLKKMLPYLETGQFTQVLELSFYRADFHIVFPFKVTFSFLSLLLLTQRVNLSFQICGRLSVFSRPMILSS